jgi:dihydroorotate dehydrogenase
MFERTLALVSKYRKALDEGPKHVAAPSQEKTASEHSTGDEPLTGILEKLSTSSSTQLSKTATKLDLDQPSPAPLSSNVDDLSESAPTLTLQSTPKTAPAPNAPRKVIFATGGITNGRQAREILDAGASVAQVYTAMIYSGAGTISRIKREMREDAARQGTATKNER